MYTEYRYSSTTGDEGARPTEFSGVVPLSLVPKKSVGRSVRGTDLYLGVRDPLKPRKIKKSGVFSYQIGVFHSLQNRGIFKKKIGGILRIFFIEIK